MHQEIEYILGWHFKLLEEMDYSVCDLGTTEQTFRKKELIHTMYFTLDSKI